MAFRRLAPVALVVLCLPACKLLKKRHVDAGIGTDPMAASAPSGTVDFAHDDDTSDNPREGSTSGLSGATGVPKLAESYPSKNGLITVHYSSDFVGKTIGTSVVQLQRVGKDDADLSFISIPEPVSDKLEEFARVLVGAEIPKLSGYRELKKKTSHCAGGEPGIEIDATWRPQPTALYHRWSCTFLKDGHGYSFSYDVPESKHLSQGPTLRQIVAATTFTGDP